MENIISVISAAAGGGQDKRIYVGKDTWPSTAAADAPVAVGTFVPHPLKTPAKWLSFSWPRTANAIASLESPASNRPKGLPPPGGPSAAQEKIADSLITSILPWIRGAFAHDQTRFPEFNADEIEDIITRLSAPPPLTATKEGILGKKAA